MSAAADADSELERPLAGLMVLDLLGEDIAGVTRPFLELGAEVVRVEPRGAFAGHYPRSAPGLRWLAANRGKRIVAPDETTLRVLIDRADLIVTAPTQPGPEPRRRGTVVMTVSMFGTGNSFENWQATDPILHALSGELSRSGLPGREPLLPPGELAMQCAMTQAAYAGMAALYAAQVTGEGDRLDVSLLDAAVQALDPGFGISGSATHGISARHLPRGRPEPGQLYPIFPCADGQVRLCVLAPRQWQGLFRWMGEPAEFAGPEYLNNRFRQASVALGKAMAAFVANRSCAELEHEGGAHGVPISAVLSIGECLASPHVVARGAVGAIQLPDGSPAWMPTGSLEIDGSRMSATGSPPGAGPAAQMAAANASIAAAPLAGLKVLDLGVIVIGGEQGRLLADLGADVVKVESSSFPDGVRHSYLPTGLSVSFAAGHRNKRSLGLDLRSPEGKALFLRLVAEADVILSNFKPGTMESLGLDYATLAATNPRIVTVESSAFGASGPWAGRMGYGPLVRAAAGLTAQWRYADDPASFSDTITIYPDHVGARVGAIGALALLTRRLRTGRGGRAALSQMEVMLSHMAARIGAESLGLTDFDDPPDAPWGVFRAAGDDEWCVVTVRDDADWAALTKVVEHATWTGCEDLTAAGRRTARGSIDRAFAQWMERQDADRVMSDLQAAGVPAARMLRVADLPEFGYYQERDFYRVDQHPLIDEPIIAERRLAGSRLLRDSPSRPAPLLGEHSASVVHDWLGLTEAEICRLLDQGVIEPVPAAVAAIVAAGEGRGPV